MWSTLGVPIEGSDIIATLHPIWKLESEDPTEAGFGQFCFHYLLAIVTGRALYLGECKCATARQLRTPIMASRSVVRCVFCGRSVALVPVPRVRDGYWVYATEGGGGNVQAELGRGLEDSTDEAPF